MLLTDSSYSYTRHCTTFFYNNECKYCTFAASNSITKENRSGNQY